MASIVTVPGFGSGLSQQNEAGHLAEPTLAIPVSRDVTVRFELFVEPRTRQPQFCFERRERDGRESRHGG